MGGHSRVLLVAALGTAAAARPGLRDRRRAIVGGTVVTPHDFPFVLSLRDAGDHICGAALVGSTWALTAAHCVHADSHPARYSLGVHQHTISNDADHDCSQVISASEITVHPQFDKATLHGDLALIRLADPVRCAASIPMLIGVAIDRRPRGRTSVCRPCTTVRACRSESIEL